MNPRLRVLVIDDSDDDFYLILRRLRRDGGYAAEGRRVCTEADLRGALGVTWDLILVDWFMPQLDAPAALRILRELEVMTPCLVVSGTVGEDVALMARDIGARDFVRKDRLESLVPIVARELARAGPIR